MSRQLKRVPLSFDWPMGKTWGGYLNPYYKLAVECPDCEHGYDRAGGRPDANAALFYAQWYGNAPFDPIRYGAEPITPDNPVIRGLACRNVDAAPDFYMTSDEKRSRQNFRQTVMEGVPGDGRPLIPFPVFDRAPAIAREAERLYEVCFRDHWKRHLIQADVDALIEEGRLMDFTHRPRTSEQAALLKQQHASGGSGYWLGEPNGYHPTAAEVNAWSLEGMAHDAINCSVCIDARCKREGVPSTCARCEGSGRIWPSPKIEQKYENWVDEDPPTGEGYQLWEDCSEGSPISPVFTSLDDLCTWAEDHATTFAHFKATAVEWKAMLDGGFVHAKNERGDIFL